MYQRLGQPALHIDAATNISTALQVLFESGGGQGGVEPLMQGDDPVIRMVAASLPDGVVRGDRFVVAGVEWRAREAAVPLLDGAEWQVPLAKAA